MQCPKRRRKQNGEAAQNKGMKALDYLLIFVKNPQAGQVKTRLAKDLGNAKALQIYEALLEKTRLVAEATDAKRLLFYSDFIPSEDPWSPTLFQKHLQQGQDLGQRMFQAFRLAFSLGATRAVIIGSDCPQLSPELLTKAFHQLQQHPFVLGPSRDGGYYLLGMTRLEHTLFEQIPWSTPQVAQLTIDRIRQLNTTCSLLPVLSDIDYASDWEQYGWELE